jgi:transcription initiation factor TFIID subunit 5
LVGHHDDVDVVRFHPNCHYLATGSADRSIRLWDVSVGQSVRVMVGHQAEVTSLSFDSEGRYCYSGAADGQWIQWDISSARIIAQGNATPTPHTPHRSHTPPAPSTAALTSLSVSGEGDMLATGTMSGQVSVWSINRGGSGAGGRGGGGGGGEGQPLQSWKAKNTAITHLHFSPRNLLMALGKFQLQ